MRRYCNVSVEVEMKMQSELVWKREWFRFNQFVQGDNEWIPEWHFAEDETVESNAQRPEILLLQCVQLPKRTTFRTHSATVERVRLVL